MIMIDKRNLTHNAEGYPDPTAYNAIRNIINDEAERDNRAFALIRAIKSIIQISGFELIERIKLKDTETGREYK